MHERNQLAARFEAHRSSLRSLALRMLGSVSEADDAVQEAWLRLDRTQASEVDNLGGWLRTVVARICLDMLRARRSRREEPLGQVSPEPPRSHRPESGPQEDEALLAESLSQALLLVLGTLQPAERIAFVLHDMFAVPFEEIAPLLERTPSTTKKLASRARHKVHAAPVVCDDDLASQAQLVRAFLTAARAGDLPGVMRVLAPNVVRTADATALPVGAELTVHGRDQVARGVLALAARSRRAELLLLDGRVGVVVGSEGRLQYALRFEIEAGMIAAYHVIAEPARLRKLRLAVLPQQG